MKKSKNAPSEISSKIPTSRKRIITAPSYKPRDPRFDSLSGHFNPSLYQRSYGSFLDDMQKQELHTLKDALKKVKDEEQKQAIEQGIQSFSSRLKQKEIKVIEKVNSRQKRSN